MAIGVLVCSYARLDVNAFDHPIAYPMAVDSIAAGLGTRYGYAVRA